MGNKHGECRWWSWSPKAQPIGTNPRTSDLFTVDTDIAVPSIENRLWLQRVHLWESIVSAIPIAIWNITDIRQLDCMENFSRNVKCKPNPSSYIIFYIVLHWFSFSWKYTFMITAILRDWWCNSLHVLHTVAAKSFWPVSNFIILFR